MASEKEKQLLEEMPGRLLRWYDGCARVLPWREEPTPYRVWVSEIMLQQTRVEAVKPYYERFLSQLPTVQALAEAPEEQLLKLWEGLGYYNRVRNLQKGARQVMERFGGEVPADFQALRSLSGVGDYTAGAIASIAFGIPVPAVDGNVLRVISRLLAREDDILDPRVKKRMEGEVAVVIPQDRAGDFNQSLMELGAMVCLPNGTPKCGECPLGDICRAHALGLEGALPKKAVKKARRVEERTLFLLTQNGKLALSRRRSQGLLAGLWELPGTEGWLTEQEAAELLKSWNVPAEKLEKLPAAKHIFTHVEWRMTAWAANVPEILPEGLSRFIWADREELEREITLPSAFRSYFPEIEKRL
ncbi:A/G-specific adenine glycosylase [uncultured Neglectibacter sp.]|uniref:A/G-specific adenine glycosylase n=1 Tax=uncultured Neglectibacter sp. TaxID=1924108 RepID=UPI0034DEAABF